jgi:hypothetical protein
VVQQSESAGSTPSIQFKKAGPGSCGWLDEAASTTIGGAAHLQIQKALTGRGLVAEFPPIPRAIKKPSNVVSPKCQPVGTAYGRPDLSRLSGAGMAISEIKPWWRASSQGLLEAVHYQRRARQSMQRLFHVGQCGTQSPGPDDYGFQADAGVTAASTFGLLKGIISGDQDFGVFAMDPHKNLFAREAAGGAIGYWCKLNEQGNRAKEEEKERKRKEKERKREEKERKKKEKGEKGKGEKERAEKEKAEKAEKEKAEKEKGEGSAGAANVGFGISIFSESVGAGNAGVGISIGSSSAAVGTAGAGISLFSDTAGAGAAGVGISKDSQAAGAGVAGAGTSSGSTAVAVGAVGAGTSTDVTSAGAGVATAGHAEDSMGAAAGVAAKGDVSGSIAATAGAKTSGDVSGAVGAGTGSPTVAVDPRDVSGPGADRVPSGQSDAEVMAKDAGKPGATMPGSGASQHPSGGTAAGGAGGGQHAGTGTEPGQSPQTPGARSGGPGMTSAGQGVGPADPGTSAAAPGAAPGPSAPGTTAGTTAGQQTAAGGAGPGGGTTKSQAPGNLAVVPVVPITASAADRQRVDAEAAKVAAMLQHAHDAQRLLLQYLASQSTNKQYVVPTSDWVAKLLRVTNGLSPEDVEYLKQLDWKPGHLTEQQLREHIQKALANRKTHPGHADQSASGGEPSRGVGHKGGSGPHGPSAAAGGHHEKAQQPSQVGGGGRDRASAPPPSVTHKASGASFGFVILSGMTASSQLRQGQAVDCTVRIVELDSRRTFVLEGVSITFDSRKDPTTFNVYFTHDFWSQKFGFHGLGGKETLNEYSFGKPKPGKR